MTDPARVVGEYWGDQSYGNDPDGNPVTPHDPSEYPFNWLPEQANQTRDALNNHADCIDAVNTLLSNIEAGATADQTGAEIAALLDALTDRNPYTDGEKSKLAGLEESKFKGQYGTLTELQTAYPSPSVGDYADVGSPVERYIEDAGAWALGTIPSGETAASVKSKYESNVDTNPLTDTLLAKLQNIAAGAEVNLSGPQMKALLVLIADTNFLTDAQLAKLNSSESGATADQTGSEIAARLDALANFNALTDALKTKLEGIEAGATEDQTASEIVTAAESVTDKNFLSDAEQTKLGNIATAATANDTDANLRARSSHTGTQTASTISDFDTAVDGNSTVSAHQAKLQHVSVTQPVDLDSIEARVNELDAPVLLKGAWDASTGTFPSGVKAGWSYIVFPAGIVDNREFSESDRLIALVDNASTTTYGGNWHKADYSDKVQAVNNRTGSVTGLAEQTSLDAEESARIAADDALSGQLAGFNSTLGAHTTQLGNLGDLSTKDTVGTGDIDGRAVAFAKLPEIANLGFLGRISGGTGDVERISATHARTIIDCEEGATADQTPAEIVAAAESVADKNFVTDAELAQIGTGGQAFFDIGTEAERRASASTIKLWYQDDGTWWKRVDNTWQLDTGMVSVNQPAYTDRTGSAYTTVDVDFGNPIEIDAAVTVHVPAVEMAGSSIVLMNSSGSAQTVTGATGVTFIDSKPSIPTEEGMQLVCKSTNGTNTAVFWRIGGTA